MVKAKNRETGEVVAIKMIKNISKSTYISKKSYREVAIMRQLSELSNGQHVVQVKDVKLIDNNVFIIMEYLPYNLDEYLSKI